MTGPFQFSPLGSDQVNFVALRQSAERDPIGMLDRCREQMSLIDLGARRSTWIVDVALFETAYTFEKPAHFAKLKTHPYFAKRKYKADIKDVLRLTLLAGLNADTEGRTYQRACRVSRALQPFFNDGIDTSAVLEAIEKAGGYNGLLSGDDQDESDDAFDFTDFDSDSVDDNLIDDDDQSANGAGTDSNEIKDESPPRTSGDKSGRRTPRTRFDTTKHLLLDADAQQLSDALSTPRNGVIRIIVCREDDEGDFCRLTVLSVDREPQYALVDEKVLP